MVGSPKCHKNIAIRKICAKSIFTFKVSGLAAVFFTKLVVIKKFFVGMFLVHKNYAMQKNILTSEVSNSFKKPCLCEPRFWPNSEGMGKKSSIFEIPYFSMRAL